MGNQCIHDGKDALTTAFIAKRPEAISPGKDAALAHRRAAVSQSFSSIAVRRSLSDAYIICYHECKRQVELSTDLQLHHLRNICTRFFDTPDLFVKHSYMPCYAVGSSCCIP